jgi:hypothetical protein
MTIKKVGTIKNTMKGVVIKNFIFEVKEYPSIYVGYNAHKQMAVICVNRPK